MKKLLILLTFILFPLSVDAKEVNLYLFYGQECPHCKEEMTYLEELKESYDFNIIKYETWHNEENAELLTEVKSKLKMDNPYVPFTVIDNLGLTGFNENTKVQIENRIKYCLANECIDILDEDCVIEEPCDEATSFTLPILGNINAKEISLPLVSIILGFLDGFNPCAMWILIFLISFLISTGNIKRMKILGSTFLLTSATIYFFFMMAWLNISIQMNKVIILRNGIAMLAIIMGIWNLIKYVKESKKEVGCTVTNKQQRIKIMERIKKYVSENHIGLAIVGIMALAVTVNIIELACSAGFPLLFTQILSLNDLNSLEYLIYVLLYIIFFLIDDIIIFLIAITTSKVTGISNKYTKYSHLIGGIIMLIVGVLLLVKPEIIMFQF